jgi:hypothetical protein
VKGKGDATGENAVNKQHHQHGEKKPAENKTRATGGAEDNKTNKKRVKRKEKQETYGSKLSN